MKKDRSYSYRKLTEFAEFLCLVRQYMPIDKLSRILLSRYHRENQARPLDMKINHAAMEVIIIICIIFYYQLLENDKYHWRYFDNEMQFDE